MKTDRPIRLISYPILSLLLAPLFCWPFDSATAQQTDEPGKQLLVAGWTPTAPQLDGDLGPEEWQAAVPFFVDFTQPKTLPGLIGGGGEEPWATLSSPEDLSYTIYAMYDEENLYIAVDVIDDVLWNDSAVGDNWMDTWEDDDVEIFIDGDGVPNDISNQANNREGFQLMKVWDGPSYTFTEGIENKWAAESGNRLGGYLVEFRIELDTIDMIDGEGTAVPGPGDSIGFNVGVGDDDNGGRGYNADQLNSFAAGELVDSYGAWAGNWEARMLNEEWWGTLYFQPPEGTAVESSTWGQVKNLQK